MRQKIVDTSFNELIEEFHSDTARVPTIKLYQDRHGDMWQFVPIAVDTNTVNELRLRRDAGEMHLEVSPLSEVIPPDDLRETEMKWLQENQQELAARYPGEWIAIDGRELVAHAGDLPTLLEQARQANHPNPFITAIPAQPITSLHM